MDYSKVSLVESVISQADNPDAIIKHLILNSDFEVAYYFVCRYITKRSIEGLP